MLDDISHELQTELVSGTITTNTVKRKHKTLSLSEKAEILRRIEAGESANKLAVEYDIGRATISGLKKKKEDILNHEDGPPERKTLRRGAYPLVDAIVYSWYTQQKSQNVHITSQLLQRKAKYFYSKLCPDEDKFKASEGWLHKFRKRFGIGYLSVEGDKSLNVNANLPYQKLFLKKIDELGLSPDQIYNATESGIFWRLLPNDTFAAKQTEDGTDTKVSKDQVTFMVCANAAGNHKVKLLLVGKSEAAKSFQNCLLPVKYKYEKRGWIDRELFKDWFDYDFVPSVRQHLAEKNLPKRALLILDNAPGHPDELISDDGYITTMFLPPCSMPLIQSMEQNVMKAIKLKYWKNLLVHVLSQSEDAETTLMKLNINDVYMFFVDAWDLIGPNLIKTSWKGLWQKKVIPEIDFVEPEEMDTIVQLLMKISTSGKLNENQIKTWVTGKEGSKLTDDEIVEAALNDNKEVDVEIKKEDGVLVTHEQAINHFNSCIQWATENSLPQQDISTLLQLRREAVLRVVNRVKDIKE